jgi:type III pantothenate kinase
MRARMPVPHAEFLLIDNSNSFTKIALATRTRLLAVRKLPTASLTEKNLSRVFSRWRFATAVLSSVVPEKARVIARALRGTRIVHVSSAIELGVAIDYPKPATIGADRLANAAIAASLFGGPVVVVDFGTAVSFDVVSKDNAYVGGVIAPGLASMTEYMHARTALLPKITLHEPPAAIGKSTRGAMLAGAVHGYRGLVRQILIEIARELGAGKKFRVIATGGYADLIARGLPEIHAVQPNLTLEGLRQIGSLNASVGMERERTPSRNPRSVKSNRATHSR